MRAKYLHITMYNLDGERYAVQRDPSYLWHGEGGHLLLLQSGV